MLDLFDHTSVITMRKTAISLCGLLLCLSSPASVAASDVQATVITDQLEHPWSLTFLPDGRMLVSERPGRLRIIENGQLLEQAVSGLPEISEKGQGGLLDIALHPQFADNGWVYLAYAAPGTGGHSTHIGRGQLRGNRLSNWQKLFELRPRSRGGRHFGSRLVFDHNGLLYVTIGDRGEQDRAQQLDDAAGSVLRLQDNGKPAADNPYLDTDNALPQLFSIGHRNPQGAALHPKTGELWTHEHGPQGGDEINIIKAGRNYGWPVITYGCQYVVCSRIGEGTAKASMEQPLHYWVPSIAPSGMAFYSGNKIPAWHGNLFIGSLKFHRLHRLVLDGEKVLKEETLFEGEFGRIRDVRNGPDGYLYLLTDDDEGKLVRIGPG